MGGGGRQSPPLTLGARHSATISMLAPGTQSVITCHFAKNQAYFEFILPFLYKIVKCIRFFFKYHPPGTENVLARTLVRTICYMTPGELRNLTSYRYTVFDISGIAERNAPQFGNCVAVLCHRSIH